MKILISGIDGYIGTVMAQFFQKNGHIVEGIDTGFYRGGWLYNGIEAAPRVLNKDIRDITENDLKGYDAVIHLADLSNDPLGTLNESVTYAINHEGAVEFARKVKQAGVKRYIYSSSCSVYGIATQLDVSETSATNPQTAYAICKKRVEDAVSALADENFSPVFLRNATVFGPSPRMRFDLVVNNLVGTAIAYKQIRLSSDGSAWRPLVHIEDVCQAFLCAAEARRDAVHNQIFNVGDINGNYQIKEVAQYIKEAFPECEITMGNSNRDVRSYKVSFAKINTKLPGFKCKYDLKAGIMQLKTLFAAISLTREQFESADFTRILMIQKLQASKQLDTNYRWIIKSA